MTSKVNDQLMATFAPFSPGYYPGGLYAPDPWQTKWIPKHFPEHHHPFEHTRHSVSHALGEIAHELTHSWVTENSMVCPRMDTRESKTAFYIDVDLPGLESESDMKLSWLNSRTLLLRATITRKPTPEDPIRSTAEKANDKLKPEASKEETRVFITVSERQIGVYGRAFNFPVDVDHDKSKSELHAGVLSLVVPKIEEPVKKDVKIDVKKVDGTS